MSYENLLTQTCTIEQRAYSPDDFGQQIESWSDRAVDVPCRFDPSGFSVDKVGRQLTTGQFRLFIKKSQEVILSDRIVFEGETYRVLDVFTYQGGASCGQNHHKELVIERITFD